MPARNSLAPRLHGAYDLFGNARTVIKGGWARYYHMRSSDDLQIANKNTISQARYRWRDLNGNRDYDPGEVNLDPNGRIYRSHPARHRVGVRRRHHQSRHHAAVSG